MLTCTKLIVVHNANESWLVEIQLIKLYRKDNPSITFCYPKR